MEAREVIRDARLALDPDQTARDWAPLLPGDPRPMVFPERGAGPLPLAGMPSIGTQIFSREAEMVGRDLVRIGRRLHAPFVASLPPRNPKPFGELMRAVCGAAPEDPLRAAFSLTPDGFDGMTLKGALARILSFSSETSRQLSSAIASLKALAEGGDAVVGLSMAFDTFVDIRPGESLGEAEGRLRARLGRLSRKIAGWGQAQVREIVGDPLLGVCATLPGMFPQGGPAPRAAAPLSAAWSFFPVRPASPWERGVWPLRSPSGKLMPLAPMSSRQPAWIDMCLAPMGGGKSVTMNTLNLAFCLQPGLSALPFLSIIDVGPSSSGLISLLRSALPEGRRHLAVHHKLTMDPAKSINPMDTPLGCREPLSDQLSFLVNLLCLMATPLNSEAPPPGADGLVRLAILSSYRELSDKPRLIRGDADPELMDIALSAGFKLDEKSSWWELADYLFSQGLPHEASLAQRLAVPTIADVAACARTHPGIRAAYGFNAEGTGEPIIDYVWRALAEAAGAYKCLCSPTRFSLGDARVVSLDLDEVATRGGGAAAERRTAVMYMAARHLAGGRFFMTPSLLRQVPTRYRAHHEEMVRRARTAPKRLCYDELHRVTGLESMRRQLTGDLETCARESRKWNLSLGLCSQNWEDFPKPVVELATTVFLLGSGTERGRRELESLFGLNPLVSGALARCGKPSPAGAEMAAIFRTSEGPAQQLVVNTLPPELLWAFSTTSEDMAVRDALYSRYGVEKTLSALAALHPMGLKNEAERRKEARRAYSFGDAARAEVLEELIAEIGRAVESGRAPLQGPG
jgi:intracellular multiplication protein IcmB